MSERLDCPVSREELAFVVEMALLKKRKLWPTRRRPGDHDSLKPMARAIAEHIELCGIRCIGKTDGDGCRPHPLDCSPGRERREPAATSRALDMQPLRRHLHASGDGPGSGQPPDSRKIQHERGASQEARRPARDQASHENEEKTASMFLPGFDDVMEIHRGLVETFRADGDPIEPHGARDEGLVHSACLRPGTGLGDRDKYGTVFEKAAALFHSLVRNHAFHNGNKRTALVTLLATLHRNGLVLDRPVNDDDVYELTVAMADGGFPGSAGRLDPDTAVQRISGWLRSNAVPRDDAPSDMRTSEFRNVDDPGERASIVRYMGALRRLAWT